MAKGSGLPKTSLFFAKFSMELTTRSLPVNFCYTCVLYFINKKGGNTHAVVQIRLKGQLKFLKVYVRNQRFFKVLKHEFARLNLLCEGAFTVGNDLLVPQQPVLLQINEPLDYLFHARESCSIFIGYLCKFVHLLQTPEHSILVRKLRNQCKLPASIINWIIDFLSDRSQRIKFTSECFSEWGPVPAGVPQGTKLGPWLFVLMINDLDTNAQQWKYVDDTTVSEVVVKGGESHVQAIANRVIKWSHENRVQLNADKCKELRISFAKEQRAFDPVIIEGKEVELVTSTKLLGLTIANDLTWNVHVTEITKKASKRLYFLTQLKRAGVPKQDLAMFYVSCVRSVIDYAAPVFFNGLPKYLKNELVRLEKRAMSIITSGKCNSAIEVGVTPILDHHYGLCNKLFDNIVSDPNHKLKALLPPGYDNSRYNLRRQRHFNIPKLFTNRTKNTFIYAMSRL